MHWYNSNMNNGYIFDITHLFSKIKLKLYRHKVIDNHTHTTATLQVRKIYNFVYN